MSILGAAIASSVAGTAQAERLTAAEREKSERARPRGRATGRGEDEVELHRVEKAEAIRSLANNTDEEAREDHQEHPAYSPNGLIPADGLARSIDIEG